MIQLKSDQYHIAASLLPDECDSIEPKAVVEGNNPGWIFVDSLDTPQAALIWSDGAESFYLAGRNPASCSQKLCSLFDNHSLLSHILDGYGYSDIIISSVSPKTGSIPEIFPSRRFSSWKRCVFIYPPCATPPPSQLVNGVLRDLRSVIMERSISNFEYIADVLWRHWGSVDNFLHQGAGFCVIVGDLVAAFSFTGCVSSFIHNMNVITLEQYRRRGYGEICAASLINAYKSAGQLPYWECDDSHHGAMMLAEKLGFEKKLDYACYMYERS